MKIRYHLLIITLILFLTSFVKNILNILKLNQENQEVIESLWIFFSTGYVLFIMYKLYIKYPTKFNPDYEKQKTYNEKVNISIKNLSDNSKSSNTTNSVNNSNSISIGDSNQPKLEKFCPRCVGKGYVDENDIKRLKSFYNWHSGVCGFCKGTGYVERSDTRDPTLGTTTSSKW
jgi:hypothetical protein